MGRIIQKVLRECITELVENVKPDDGLLDCLYSKGLVTVRNRQNVLSSGTPYKQMAELIDILSSKDDVALDEMISFLQRERGDAHIAQMLLDSKRRHDEAVQGTLKSASTNDFSLSQKSIPVIARILLQSPQVLTNWTIVSDAFVQTALDAYQIKRAVNQGDLYTAIKLTLDTWLAVQGKSATFQTLVAKLNEHGLTDSTENLEASREAIKSPRL